jgi:DNA-directed RNA polymerase beta' subunit
MAKKTTRKKASSTRQVPTLRAGLSDTLNDLNIARMRSTNPQEQLELQRIIRALMLLWEYVIYEQMDKRSGDYKDAIKAVTAAKTAAKQAVQDMEGVAEAIKKATQAAKVIDKIVGLALKVI